MFIFRSCHAGQVEAQPSVWLPPSSAVGVYLRCGREAGRLVAVQETARLRSQDKGCIRCDWSEFVGVWTLHFGGFAALISNQWIIQLVGYLDV